MILDSTFAIDLMRGEERAVAKAAELEEREANLLVPAPVFFELFEGVVHSDAPMSERRKVRQFGKAYGQIAFSYEEAQTGGEILGELLLRGQPIGLIDSMIAGIAIEHDEAILTRNPKDFEKVSEIEVKTY